MIISVSACIDNGTQLPCLHSGEEIFHQYSFSPNNFKTDLIALSLLYLTFNALAFFLLWRRIRNISK